jgi:ribosomal protein S18 acetylase RimI-like enzyme
MAVDERAQGAGIGRKLIDACIAAARDAGAHRLYLESNSSLAPALSLYRSAGFVDLPARPTPYARCDVWMELKLR